MTIEDLDKIDIFGASNDGPLLVIVDPGTLPADLRFQDFRQKVAAYVRCIGADEFQADNPGWRGTVIELASPMEPTQEMKKVNGVRMKDLDGLDVDIEIRFQIVESSFGLPSS